MSEKHETDAQEVKEILEVVAEKIPAVLNSLTDVLYGKASAAKYGEAVSNFYKTLKESGMTDDQAFKLTEQYMSSLNFVNILGKAIGGGHRGRGEDDVGEGISEQIREGIRNGLKARASERREDDA